MSGAERRVRFVVKKASSAGLVTVNVSLRCGGLYSDRARIEGSAELNVVEARELAQSLIEHADREDAKLAARFAAEERRKKWREREIAAGRMKVFSPSEIFR